MENIYFPPNKKNSEFLAKLDKLDEYTIPKLILGAFFCTSKINMLGEVNHKQHQMLYPLSYLLNQFTTNVPTLLLNYSIK